MRNRHLVFLAAVTLATVASDARATVTTETRKVDYTCSGASSYAYTFPVLSTSDLTVIKYTGSCGSATSTTLTLGATFSAVRTSTGGTVSLTGGATCTAGYCLRIQRIVEYTQETSFRSQGAFSPAAHEAAFDKLTMEVQQLQDGIGQSEDTALAIQAHIASSDDHTAYFRLGGRTGGQTANGGTAAGENLYLQGNPDGDGLVCLGYVQSVTWDDSTRRLGVNATPAGAAVKATGANAGDEGVTGTGYTTGYGVYGVGGTTDGTYGLYATSSATNGGGVIGQGTGTYAGVLGQGGGTSGIGTGGVGGSPNGIGVYGYGSGTGTGVYGDATLGTGYGVVATADTTSPVRASLRVVPQDTAPTTCAVGDVYVNSSTAVPYLCTVAGTPGTWTQIGSGADHGTLTGLSDDDHTQYAKLAGRSGGQTFYGSTVAGENVTITPNSAAADGKVLFGASGAYDVANERLGINTTAPTYNLHVLGTAYIGSTLSVFGIIEGGSDIHATGTGDLRSDDDLIVNDDASIGDTLTTVTIVASGTIGTVGTGDLSSADDLTVADDATVGDSLVVTGDLAGKWKVSAVSTNQNVPASDADCNALWSTATDGLTFTLANISAAYDGCTLTFVSRSATATIYVAIDASDYMVGSCMDGTGKVDFDTAVQKGIYNPAATNIAGDKVQVVADSTNNWWHILNCSGTWARIP